MASLTTALPSRTISAAKLFKMAFDGHDLKPLRSELVVRAQSGERAVAAAALMNLCVIEQLLGDKQSGLERQSEALRRQRLYRSSWPASPDALQVLAFLAPGDIGTNAPIEFLLDGSDIVLHRLYVIAGQPIPLPLPAHDIAIVTPCESDQNRPVLREIERLIPTWPCPVLNRPQNIGRASRELLFSLLQPVPGLSMPATARVSRAELEHIGCAAAQLDSLLGNASFPLIARPVDSHAGRALAKLDAPAAVAPYLASQPDREFFISPFIDYRGADGLFRKYRLIWVDGRVYPCHLAISEDWKVWYYNAGMAVSAAKRDEEARFMAEFDTGFARRHASALAQIATQFGLEYFGVDCAELRDGRLLVFEGGNDLVVHDMDPPDLYPYKSAHMQKIFVAFRDMLKRQSVNAPVAV